MREVIRLIIILLWLIVGMLVLKSHTVSELQYWLLWANMMLILIGDLFVAKEK